MMSSFAAIYLVIKIKMNLRKVSIAALFLTASFTTVYAQQDTVKTEKKLEGVTIKGTTKKGAESNIISIQKKSVEVIERVGSVQLEKQGVGDVSVAVTKATGAQKQEGSGQVFIRGLGDRSNATTMNGLPIPSNDPMYKNIDLSIIKTDMIDFVGLEKVYSPRMWGDMSGANVDIVSKVYTGKPYFKVSLGSSVNLNAIKKDHFHLQDGIDYFGFKLLNKPSNASVINHGFAFSTSTKDKEIYTPINSSLGIDFGRSFNIGDGKLSLFGYGSFENDYSYFKGITGGAYDGGITAMKLYNDSEEYKYGTNTTGLINLNYKINSNHTLNYSSNYIHTTEQKLGYYSGFNRDYLDDPQMTSGYTMIRRATNKVNNLFINQLKGEHTITDPFKLFWNIGYNRLDSRRPDRQQNATVYDRATGTNYFASSNPGANHRYFDKLIENDYVGNITAEYELSEKAKIAFGYNGRYKDSDFRAHQYNFRIKVAPGNYYVDTNNYDSFFNLGNYQTGAYFDIVTFRGDVKFNPQNALIPQYYQSEVLNNAGFANLDYKFSDAFTAQLGVRYDNLDQKLIFNTALSPNGDQVQKNYSKILPALNLKYAVNDRNNLRFSASKTYTTPLLLEVAPFEYEDVDEASYGNIDLYPSDNYNADLKWEFFPKRSELLSVTAFAKYIQNPIARITASTSANTTSFVNVGDTGMVYGAEMELRKDLYQVANTKFYTFLNATYLNTNQKLDAAKIAKENKTVAANFIKDNDKMTGASDLLANVNLGWEQKWNGGNVMDFVLSYSHISDNVYALGFESRGNLVDKAINSLDAIAKFKLKNGIGFSFSGKNLLDPTYKRVQENQNNQLVVKEFKKGINLGAGVSYEF